MPVALMENTGESNQLSYLLANDRTVLKIVIRTGFSFSFSDNWFVWMDYLWFH